MKHNLLVLLRNLHTLDMFNVQCSMARNQHAGTQARLQGLGLSEFVLADIMGK